VGRSAAARVLVSVAQLHAKVEAMMDVGQFGDIAHVEALEQLCSG